MSRDKVEPMCVDEPDEPPFESEQEMFLPPVYGRHTHRESDLRGMWSWLWSRFNDQRMCREFMRYNRQFSLDTWREAVAKSKVKNIRYIMAIASRLEITEGRQ